MNNEYYTQIDKYKLIRYLNELGFEKFPTKRESVQIYQKFDDSGNFLEQVTVPLDSKLYGYDRAMKEAFDTLCAFTGLTGRLLAIEIMFPKSDVLNFHLENDEISVGAYSLDEIVNFYNSSKKLITATAMDVTSPKLIQKGRASEQSRAFIDGCRFGQTEIGSYQVPVICPEIVNSQRSIFEFEDQLSFSRTIEVKLLNNVRKLKSSIEDGSFDERLFDNTEQPEMSTTFLKSVHRIIEKPSSSLVIQAHWNKHGSGKVPDINQAEINNEYASSIHDVLNRFRLRLKGSLSYTGRISELKAEEDAQNRDSGQISLKYMDGDNVKSVSIKLNSEEYKQAVRCHERGLYVNIHTERQEGSLIEKCVSFAAVDEGEDE